MSFHRVLPIMILAVAGYACSSSGPAGPDDTLTVSVTSSANQLNVGGSCHLVCSVTGAGGGQVSFAWSATGGSISGSGSQVDWQAPEEPGNYDISCTATAAGGETESGSVTVRVLDPTLGYWEDFASMPNAVQEIQPALLGDKIYVVGGLDASAMSVRTVHVYDPATDSWSTAAPLPVPRNHIAVAAAGGKLFAFGGANDVAEPQPEVYMYDPVGNRWTSRAPMPVPRFAAFAVTVGSKIHVIGGATLGSVAQSRHDLYDPETDEWSVLAYMPTAREHPAAAVIDSVIYVVGGREIIDGMDSPLTKAFDVLEAYDVRTGSWATLAPLREASSAMAVTALDGTIYAFGGEVLGTDPYMPELSEAYDPGTDAWRSLTPPPWGRHGTSAVAYEGVIYVIGGGVNPALGPTPRNSGFVPYSPAGVGRR